MEQKFDKSKVKTYRVKDYYDEFKIPYETRIEDIDAELSRLSGLATTDKRKDEIERARYHMVRHKEQYDARLLSQKHRTQKLVKKALLKGTAIALGLSIVAGTVYGGVAANEHYQANNDAHNVCVIYNVDSEDNIRDLQKKGKDLTYLKYGNGWFGRQEGVHAVPILIAPGDKIGMRTTPEIAIKLEELGKAKIVSVDRIISMADEAHTLCENTEFGKTAMGKSDFEFSEPTTSKIK